MDNRFQLLPIAPMLDKNKNGNESAEISNWVDASSARKMEMRVKQRNSHKTMDEDEQNSGTSTWNDIVMHV